MEVTMFTYVVVSKLIHLCMHCCRHCYNGLRNFHYSPKSKKKVLGKNLVNKKNYWQAKGSIQSVCIVLSLMMYLHLVLAIKAMIPNCSYVVVEKKEGSHISYR